MKKLFAVTIILALVLAGCSQPGENSASGNKLPTLIIKNESSHTLTNVKFMGLDFFTSGTKDLPVSSQAVKQITSDLIDKSGYITFNLKDTPGAACRTNEVITVSGDNLTFVFLDTTIVEELANSNNRKPLSQITFSRIAVERERRSVVKNDVVPLGETVVNYISQHEFSIKNTGVGKLKLIGNEPVKITGSTDSFSIIQPANSEVNPDGTMSFKVNFNPKAIQPYSTQITIYSDDQNGDFTFTITAAGTAPKPIAKITYETSDIAQNGTINIGDVFITLSKVVNLTIKNTGTEVLTIEPENITITGADAAAFTKLTNPGGNISIGSQTSFNIEFKPTKQGEHNVTLTIPTNDNSRNPVEIYLKGTGVKGTAVLELSQNNVVIPNNSLTPIDFGQVELTTNKLLVFTIKNIGNIPLELTGTPIVESSNAVFTIFVQPANRIINPGTDVSFGLYYTPTDEKEDTSTITITNNSNDMLFSFLVKGTGYVKRPQITIRQDTTVINPNGEYIFGSLLINNTKDLTFTIDNTGEENLNFIAVNGNCVNLENTTGSYFSVIQQPFNATVVSPGNTAAFIIRFNPTAVGNNFIAAVHIKTNSQNNNDFYFWVKGDGRNNYKIGDTGPGGGMIFYAEGGQYKECSGELGSYTWDSAVTTAQNYRGGGFDNWHLPDRGELNLMYRNLHLNSLGGFYNYYYWSSEIASSIFNDMYYFDFKKGTSSYMSKSNLTFIRAVRSFSL